MSETVNIWRVLRIAMATAILAVVLIVPTQSQAANDCSAAGSDPTAAQYCPPNPEPIEEEKQPTAEERCTENGSNSGSTTGTSSECSEETIPASASDTTTPPSTGGGTLPFTGMDVLALLAVAGAFIAVGIALQRLSKTGVETK